MNIAPMNIASDFVRLSPLSRWHLLIALVASLLLAPALHAIAQDAEPPAATQEAPTASDPSATTELDVEAEMQADDEVHHGNNVIMRFNRDTTIAAGETVDAVVTVSGSSTSAGHVREAIVSVFGNTHVTGPVDEDAVALFGNVYVNSPVRGDVVAFLGDVTLGPDARVDGDVVVVSGDLHRDSAAIVSGDVQQMGFPLQMANFEWMRPWVKHCLLLARPLAIEPGLGWAWTLAFGFLALYVVLALVFTGSVEACARTLEERPGRTLIASLLTLVLTPVLMLVLAITIVGFAVIPFLWIALFIAGLSGKTVILAVLGRRVTRFTGMAGLNNIAIAVIVGGLIVLALYLVPILGFILFKLIGILGLGAIVYTMLLQAQSRREAALAATAAANPMPPPAAPGFTGAAPTATSPDAAAADGSTASSASAFAPGAHSTAPAAVSPPPDASLPRAGFWIRMGALLIDVILIGFALAVLKSDGVFLLVLAIYGAVMWKLKGTTVGGVICHLKVVRVDSREVDWSTAAIRALGCFLSLALLGLGFIWIALDPNRQAWHDKIAGTVVVRVPQGVPLV